MGCEHRGQIARPAETTDSILRASTRAWPRARNVRKFGTFTLLRLDVEGVDGEEVFALRVPEADLTGAKLDVEDGAEGRRLDVGLGVRVLTVEALARLVEPGADARELLLLHPDRGRLVSRTDHQPESPLAGLADGFRVYRY